MKKIHVAIIDDGINTNYIDVRLLNNIEISGHEIKENKNSSNNNTITHATFCSLILLKYSNCINISSIKILQQSESKNNFHKTNDLHGDIVDLCIALEWCANNGVNIVNLSLGSQSFTDIDLLKHKINEVTNKGIIIICSSANNQYATYPAIYSNVISVRCNSKNNLNEGEYFFSFDNARGIEVVAFSAHELLVNGINKRCSPTNSFATPMITAKVCNFMYETLIDGIEGVKLHLKKYAIDNNQFSYYSKPDWVSLAIIVFIGIDEFETRAEFYFNCHNKIHIKNFTDIDDQISNDFYDSKIDTLIFISKEKISENDIVHLKALYKKNLILIHSESNAIFSDDILYGSKKIWDSSIQPKLNYKKPYKIENISIPVAMIKLSENIDIFYLLQRIKKLFSQEHIYSFIISDYPYSVLYGMDYMNNFSSNDNDFTISNFIIDSAKKNQADIILLVTVHKNHNLPQSLKELIDINISFETNETTICRMLGKNLEFQFTYSNLCDDDVLKMFYRIIDYFNA